LKIREERIVRKSLAITIKFDIVWDNGKIKQHMINGVTTGFNVNGFGAKFKVEEQLKPVLQQLFSFLAGKFCFVTIPELNIVNVEGTFGRFGFSWDSNYDIFVAGAFIDLPGYIRGDLLKIIADEKFDIRKEINEGVIYRDVECKTDEKTEDVSQCIKFKKLFGLYACKKMCNICGCISRRDASKEFDTLCKQYNYK